MLHISKWLIKNKLKRFWLKINPKIYFNKFLGIINYKTRKYYDAEWKDVFITNPHIKTRHQFRCSNCRFISEFDYIYCQHCGCYMKNTTMIFKEK